MSWWRGRRAVSAPLLLALLVGAWVPALLAQDVGAQVPPPGGSPGPASPAPRAATATGMPTATSTTTPSRSSPSLSPSPSPDAAPGRIVEVDGYVRVIDGQTIEARIDGQRVGISVIGIETPAGNTGCGKDATARLEELVRGGIVLEEAPEPPFDERNLRRYLVRARDGRSVAQEMVQAGLARASGEGRESPSLRAAEAAAPGGCKDLTPRPPPL